MKGLTGTLPGPPTDNVLRFHLVRNNDTKTSWTQLLANPSITPHPMTVSVGFENQYPLNSTASINFRSLSKEYFALGILFLLGLLGLFICLLVWTDICRDGSPEVPEEVNADQKVLPGTLGPFSLSKLQAAVWFFIILGSYLLVVAVTFDISGTLNATALTLLGIGAATVVGAAAIETNQDNASDKITQAEAAKKLAQQIKELKGSLAAKKVRRMKRQSANP